MFMKKCIVIFSVLVFSANASDTLTEIIGENEPEKIQKTEPLERESFRTGSIYLNAGVLYGSSLAGIDAEFGVNRVIGFIVGGGFVGLNAGMTFHVLSKKHIDLFIAATGDYMPGLKTVVPDISFNVRGFFGKRARAGVCGKIGIAVVTVNRTLNGLHYEAGMPMLTYAIGVPIKIKN